MENRKSLRTKREFKSLSDEINVNKSKEKEK